jgi:hypothetical protein
LAIRPSDHGLLLDKILSDYGLAPSSLEIVPDVQAWCQRHGMKEDHPFRQAKCARGPDGAFHIAIVDVLTDDMIEGGKDAMRFPGMASSVYTLDTDLKYLVHLLLHEIAGDVLGTGNRKPRRSGARHRVGLFFGANSCNGVMHRVAALRPHSVKETVN